MARTYKRDSNGRFAGGGGTRSGRPAAKPVSRGRNRLTRDNAGTITSVGGEGATARGGRLRTAGGNLRATQTAKIKSSGGRLRKPVGGGSKSLSAAPTSGRNRKQAAAAQGERNQRLFEFSRSAFGYDGSRSDRGLKVKKTTINQGNLFTGKTDKVTISSRPKRAESLIGKSAAFKKTQVRRARAEARYDSLLQQREGVMSKGGVRAGELAQLARINQRMSAVSGAFRTYDMGTGRRPPRRSTRRKP
jgi:hypothetical protein